jgi:hypothetical protein
VEGKDTAPCMNPIRHRGAEWNIGEDAVPDEDIGCPGDDEAHDFQRRWNRGRGDQFFFFHGRRSQGYHGRLLLALPPASFGETCGLVPPDESHSRRGLCAIFRESFRELLSIGSKVERGTSQDGEDPKDGEGDVEVETVGEGVEEIERDPLKEGLGSFFDSQLEGPIFAPEDMSQEPKYSGGVSPRSGGGVEGGHHEVEIGGESQEEGKGGGEKIRKGKGGRECHEEDEWDENDEQEERGMLVGEGQTGGKCPEENEEMERGGEVRRAGRERVVDRDREIKEKGTK